MRDRYDDFFRRGIELVVVLCQKREPVAEWLEAHPVPFRVLTDADRSRAKAWGVYVRLRYDSLHIARPASFVVDPRGVIAYARISVDQLHPAPLDGILAAVS